MVASHTGLPADLVMSIVSGVARDALAANMQQQAQQAAQQQQQQQAQQAGGEGDGSGGGGGGGDGGGFPGALPHAQLAAVMSAYSAAAAHTQAQLAAHAAQAAPSALYEQSALLGFVPMHSDGEGAFGGGSALLPPMPVSMQAAASAPQLTAPQAPPPPAGAPLPAAFSAPQPAAAAPKRASAKRRIESELEELGKQLCVRGALLLSSRLRRDTNLPLLPLLSALPLATPLVDVLGGWTAGDPEAEAPAKAQQQAQQGGGERKEGGAAAAAGGSGAGAANA
jgi:hypothetical protein